VTGDGHAFWVDETTGLRWADQDAVIDYLLAVTDLNAP
jgi:hypothetical protein